MAKNKMNAIDWIASTVLVVGGLNWGLDQFLNFNLVDSIFGAIGLAPLVYGAVTVSSLYAIGRFVWINWM